MPLGDIRNAGLEHRDACDFAGGIHHGRTAGQLLFYPLVGAWQSSRAWCRMLGAREAPTRQRKTWQKHVSTLFAPTDHLTISIENDIFKIYL